jgi:DNA uptake protein ComE-like DNA-binding protein
MRWHLTARAFGFLLFILSSLEPRADVLRDATGPGSGPSAVKLEQAARAQSAPLDLNTASVRELRNLPGIGRTNSFAIRNGRPYARTEELLLRRVVPRRTYERIKGLVTAVPLPQSALTDLNTASIHELRELPGIGQSLAFAIRNGRPYAQTEELLLRRVIPRRAYERIKPLVKVTPP